MMRDDDDEMIGWGFGCSDGLRQPIGPPREVGATVVVASLFVLLKHREHTHTLCYEQTPCFTQGHLILFKFLVTFGSNDPITSCQRYMNSSVQCVYIIYKLKLIYIS